MAGGAAGGSVEAAPVEGGAPARRPLKRSTRIALIVISVVAVITTIVLVAVYVVEAGRYVSTDNAQIDGDQIVVNAPTSGTLVDWQATQGRVIKKDQIVGRIRVQGGFVQPQQAIRAPGTATVVVDNGVEGAFVAAGTQLAIAYDFSKIYVTARVDETDIDDVRIGQLVDITVDAFPGEKFTGTVREVQGGAAGIFSAFPQSNTSGNFQKVTQVIPVKIAISDTKGLALVPGMNVTVRIHKD
ncbi:Barrel-sandwich domain of CusB or HlyD membrane-fusion [Pseudonocardia thermophila]|jgi:Multidrug resistance efflux pump|uniref:Barrel-sandwich domain of CusB or HlyD membrane-fusion n=1 Tax=Pseudonocardia thermophila TaxID=1848 RepID=A0A1M6N544_PSETH|nr:efflux RND transporter periplasmic adaptor subunit [Pseudonocardia thermophila]SHJ90820.1 Barrel-sandwich domain of CusB or HlyD membrane-fusion [Pseudonocardia thermophila]